MRKTLNEYLKMPYPFLVRPLSEAEGGGWIVEFPDLKNCIGTGETEQEALQDASKAKAAWLTAAFEQGGSLPEPGSSSKFSGNFALRMPKSLHRWVMETAAREGVSANQLVTHLLSMAKGKQNSV
jgi:antitoxin HicB